MKKSFLLPVQEMCSICAVSILTCMGKWRATLALVEYTSKSETSIEFVFWCNSMRKIGQLRKEKCSELLELEISFKYDIEARVFALNNFPDFQCFAPLSGGPQPCNVLANVFEPTLKPLFAPRQPVSKPHAWTSKNTGLGPPRKVCSLCTVAYNDLEFR